MNRALRLLTEQLRKESDYTHILPGMRRLIIGPHAAFYRIKDDHIYIVRVLHQPMGSTTHLKNT